MSFILNILKMNEEVELLGEKETAYMKNDSCCKLCHLCVTSSLKMV